MIEYASFKQKVLRQYVGGIAWPTVTLMILCWLLYLSNLYLSYQGWLAPWATIFIGTICAFYSFTCFHEAAHENIEGLRRGGWLTNVVGWSAAAMLLAPFDAMRAIHLAHHQNTNDPEKDPDYWVASRYFASTLVRSSVIYFHYLYHYLFKFSSTSKGIPKNLVPLLLFWGLCLGLLWTPLAPLALYGMVIPALLGTATLALVFDWLPHHPHKERSQKLATRNYPSKFLNILVAGQNMHQLHHVNPRVPFYRYQRAYYAAMVRDIPEEEPKQSASAS